MSKENKNSIDNLVPEGWEFREEYMHHALDGLRKQQVRMKWKKVAWWSAAAAVFVVFTSTLLYVCNTGSVHQVSLVSAQKNNQEINSTAIPPDSDGPTTAQSPSTSTGPIVAAKTYAPDTANAQQSATAKAKSKEENMVKTNRSKSNKATPSPQDRAPIYYSDSSQKNVKPSAPTSAQLSPQNGLTDGTNQQAEQPTEWTSNGISTAEPQGSKVSDQYNAAPVLPEGNTASANEIAYAPAEAIASLQGTLLVTPTVLRSSALIGKGSRHAWYLWAGNTVWADYGRSTNRLDFQPLIGLAHAYRINERWSLQSHLNYVSIQDPGAVYQQVQTIYDYQQLQSTTSVVTNRLHYASLGSAMLYKFSPQWQVYAGLLGSVKITGNNTLEKTNWNNVRQSENATGYVHGFQRFNYGLHIGFNRHLNSHWSLGLQAVAGLTDVSKNHVFNEDIRQSNSQLNLILGYRIK